MKRRKQRGALVGEWRDVRIFENKEPGIYDLYRKSDDTLHSRETATGWLFFCRDCRQEHLILWQTVALTKHLLATRNIDRLLMFCVNGDSLLFWQPGAPKVTEKHRLLATWELE